MHAGPKLKAGTNDSTSNTIPWAHKKGLSPWVRSDMGTLETLEVTNSRNPPLSPAPKQKRPTCQ